MKILISGAGIAGPTLAYWLARYGIEPTLVERAPALRTGGYVIDFWGAGFDVAERMDLAPELHRRGYLVKEVRVVGREGKRVAGFSAEVFARAAAGRYVSIPRGDLAETIFRTVEGKVETIFGDSVRRVEQTDSGVQVEFEHGHARGFDLVIGADGMHSKIRELVFGPESGFEKYLGHKVAAFDVAGYRPRDELVYVMYTEVGQQVGRFSMRGDRTMFLFVFADPEPGVGDARDISSQKSLLRRRFANSGWECRQILEAMDGADALYFDRVSQIRVNAAAGSWSRNRVSLVGDAAHCVSFFAGEGSALAMAGAYILAGELHRSGGDYSKAFSRYQQLFSGLVKRKQKAAERFAGAFAPKSKLGLFVRNKAMNLMSIPWIANRVFERQFRDEIILPKYSA
jgi:2-polyprenyl-6-methoxyphenol hydroxylase-like FAD-dependent oxidoreductase